MADGALRVALLARAVHPLHGVGGLERHVHDLVRHLVRRGVRLILITRPGDKGTGTAEPPALPVPPDRVRVITVPYTTFPGAGRRGTTVLDRSTAYPLFGWRAGRAAVRLAHRDEVDVVHALGASGLGYAMARLRHERTVPFVFNPQGLEEFGATHPGFATLKRLAYTPLQAAVRTCARAADAVIATDRSLVAPVLRHLPVSADRIHVIPNAVDLEAIDARRRDPGAASMRSRLGLADGERLLLSVGRLEENKGFHVLAAALGILARREGGGAGRPPWRWALVGDGPFRRRIAEAAAGAGVASRMIMPGRVSEAELDRWYEAADLFVHPTLYEGSSLVTLEAMAFARPVVATRAGGLPDKVLPGETGWLVEPGRPGELADAIEAALAPAVDAAAMGRAGRALAERAFSWSVVTDALLDVYHRLARRDASAFHTEDRIRP